MKCEQCEKEFDRLRPYLSCQDTIMVCNQCFDLLRNCYEEGFKIGFFREVTEEELAKNYIACDVSNDSSFPFSTKKEKEEWIKQSNYEIGIERKSKMKR